VDAALIAGLRPDRAQRPRVPRRAFRFGFCGWAGGMRFANFI